MVLKRMIPCLIIKDNGLVITEKFKKSKYVGDPINAIKIFNEKEADEIIVLDITASKIGREPNFTLLESIAQEAFMPLAYGGGISNIDHISKILYLGYEKVAINSSALDNLKFLENAVKEYGSSTIIGSVDVKQNFFGKYKVYNHVLDSTLSIDALEHIKNLESCGVGEILVNSVDKDGTRTGYDLKFINSVVAQTKVSLICLGSAGSYDDIKDALILNVDAVAAGSFFTLYGKHKAVLITYDKKEVLDYLENKIYIKDRTE